MKMRSAGEKLACSRLSEVGSEKKGESERKTKGGLSLVLPRFFPRSF